MQETTNTPGADTNAQFDAVLKACRDIFVKKLDDYGASWRILRPCSLTDQIFIKAKRIRSLEEGGVAMVDEGLSSLNSERATLLISTPHAHWSFTTIMQRRQKHS